MRWRHAGAVAPAEDGGAEGNVRDETEGGWVEVQREARRGKGEVGAGLDAGPLEGVPGGGHDDGVSHEGAGDGAEKLHRHRLPHRVEGRRRVVGSGRS